jgi:hypothetical protein
MRTYVTNTWATPTLSLYVATVGPEHWIRFDDASMVITPSTQTFGTDCGEPMSSLVANGNIQVDGNSSQAASALKTSSWSPKPATTRQVTPRPRSAPVPETTSLGSAVFTPPPTARSRWVIVGVPPTVTQSAAYTRIQVSDDGVNWRTVARIRTPEDWESVAIELDEILAAEETLHVRFVPDYWR